MIDKELIFENKRLRSDIDKVSEEIVKLTPAKEREEIAALLFNKIVHGEIRYLAGLLNELQITKQNLKKTK